MSANLNAFDTVHEQARGILERLLDPRGFETVRLYQAMQDAMHLHDPLEQGLEVIIPFISAGHACFSDQGRVEAYGTIAEQLFSAPYKRSVLKMPLADPLKYAAELYGDIVVAGVSDVSMSTQRVILEAEVLGESKGHTFIIVEPFQRGFAQAQAERIMERWNAYTGMHGNYEPAVRGLLGIMNMYGNINVQTQKEYQLAIFDTAQRLIRGRIENGENPFISPADINKHLLEQIETTKK
jgi:hypothetical protein